MPPTWHLPGQRVVFGVFEVDLRSGELWREGRRVPLQDQPFSVLLALLENAGEEVSRERLRQRLWPDREFLDFENGLNTAVAKLRQALGDSAESPRFIVTRPRHGYRFVAPVRWFADPAGPVSEASSGSKAPPEQPKASRALWLLLAAVVAILLAFWIAREPSRRPVERISSRPDAPRFDDSSVRIVGAPSAVRLTGSFALSPDGKTVAFVASGPALARSRLWLENLESGRISALPGSEDAAMPFWSPDGGTIAFFAGTRLAAVDVATGGVRQIVDLPEARYRGGSWGPDGTVVFAPGVETPLFSVSSIGGTPVAITDLSGAPSHRFPSFLPGGRRFLYLVLREDRDRSEIRWGDVGTREGGLLTAASSSAVYLAPGYLVFARGGELLAQKLDVAQMRLEGVPAVISEQVGVYGEDGPTGLGAFSTSAAGDLAVATFLRPRRQLAWFDRAGSRLASVGPPGDYTFLDLSPDGTRAALVRFDDRKRSSDLQVTDLRSGVVTQVTDDPWPDGVVAWSPIGGDLLAFNSLREGHWRTFVRGGIDPASEREVPCSPLGGYSFRWFADGRSLTCERASPTTGRDLWRIPVASPSDGQPLVVEPGDQVQGEVSPDGRWLAYLSNRHGPTEIYLRDLGDSSAEGGPISSGGGRAPRWQRDGRELYFLVGSNLFALRVPDSHDAGSGLPQPLFSAPIPPSDSLTDFEPSFGVARDGSRFLFIAAADNDSQPTIRILHGRRAASSE